MITLLAAIFATTTIFISTMYIISIIKRLEMENELKEKLFENEVLRAEIKDNLKVINHYRFTYAKDKELV